jgi:metallo-beta-lactamase family protein
MSKVSITFLGGAETVTGSRFLVESDEAKVLIDAGLFQGLKQLRLKNWDEFPVETSTIDAVVLTHAHLDHCGYLPLLVRQGYRNPVYLTSNTAKLAEVVMKDSARIQVEDAKYAAKKGYSKHDSPKPLYTEDDVDKTLTKFKETEFRVKTQIAKNTFITLFPAGHILGAAFVMLEIGGEKLLFTGDLGRNQHPILVAPDPYPDGEISALITESTYGARVHESPSSVFTDAINKTINRGGSILIPAFAVDRTEVILMKLRELMDTQQIPRVPVFVDSPMALTSLKHYRSAIASGDTEIRPDFIRQFANEDPFGPDTLQEMKTVEDSMKLNNPKNSCIIVSASGMGTGGRVVHHLKQMLPNPLHSVLLVGYQAVGTRGHALENGAEKIKMHGQLVDVKASIVKIEGFSVHADGSELIQWFGKGKKPNQIFLVHGEIESAEIFAQRLEIELKWAPVIPVPMKKYEIIQNPDKSLSDFSI